MRFKSIVWHIQLFGSEIAKMYEIAKMSDLMQRGQVEPYLAVVKQDVYITD